MELSTSISINYSTTGNSDTIVIPPPSDDFIINLITEFETNEFILDLTEETE